MIRGLRGTLLSHDALEEARLTHVIDARAVEARLSLATWHQDLQKRAGPAWSARLVFDRIAAPFCRAFGLEPRPGGADGQRYRATLTRAGAPAAALLATGWGHAPSSAWRDAVRLGIAHRLPWTICFTGPAVCLFDARRTHSRRHVELDLSEVSRDDRTFAVAWNLLSGRVTVEEAVRLSEQHRVVVRDSLQSGVRDALGCLADAFSRAPGRRHPRAEAAAIRDESLTVIYRVLFLLFAEARGLVPVWHRTYRESYTLDALRNVIESQPRPRGLWEALQALARLAHEGCRAGALRVPPFNGRLFSPAHAPLAESLALDEEAVRAALLALTTRKTPRGRQRIAYADLGVEHLGGVYERVLDYDVVIKRGRTPALVSTGRRKATGTFYTPRPLTEYLVRRTLAPLVTHAPADQILSLRVLDPAMGSGAFLVAACRYLAAAYEAALVRDGHASPSDIADADRAGFRRLVAQRTLFGVDVNPTSVQLARLSLWLATLSDDRPLTFFDHHLRAGNSLVGASLADVRRRLPGRGRASKAALPLFDAADAVDHSVAAGVASGLAIRNQHEDTAEQVRAKESLFARLQSADAPLARWKGIADLWCAAWFGSTSTPPPRAVFSGLADAVAGRPGGLPETAVRDLLAAGRDASRREGFFHWELEFPEVFYSAEGRPLDRPGFDAIIGNPPWEVLRGDLGDEAARTQAASDAGRLTRFVRGSGLYPLQEGGHANLYQLFVERSLTLVRAGGRIGLVLPWGFASDHGCAALRRHLLDSTHIDTFIVVDNSDKLFPIHRSLKLLVVTLTRGGSTPVIPLRSGIRTAGDFESLPDSGVDTAAIRLTKDLIVQFSGSQCAIPEIRSEADAAIVSRIAFDIPPAGDPSGWELSFGRELNATEDRGRFNTERRGLPVIEGKHLHPFFADVGAASCHMDPGTARALAHRGSFDRPRLAYRDVASSTNRLTLIAAVLPAGTVTTHTVFCLKTQLGEDDQHFLAGMFNSLVANYLARVRVTTHVTVAIVERLPMPRPARSSAEYARVVELARTLASSPADVADLARLNGLVARIYGLEEEEFRHVLTTFPLVDGALREAALRAFARTV